MQPKHKSRQLWSAMVLASFLALAAGSAETDSDASKVAQESSAYSIDATQLYQEFNANQVAADSKYKGKVATITGEIQNIGKDVTDTAYIVIGGKGFLDGVQCMLPKGQESGVAQLSKGQFVTTKGRIDGQAGNVIVRNCSLQQ